MRKFLMTMVLAIAMLLMIGCSTASQDPKDLAPIGKMFNLPEVTFADNVSVEVNNEPIDVVRFYSVDYIRYISNGKTKVAITNDKKIENVDVYPKRLGIKTTIKDKTATFISETADDFLVKVNENNWMLFIVDKNDVADYKGKEGVKDVTEYFGEYQDNEDLTQKINTALDAFKADSSVNTLYFPAKLYNVSAINFNGIEDKKVYFEPGAMFRAIVTEPYDLRPIGINVSSCKNFSILGSLFFDNGGDRVRKTVPAGNAGQNSILIQYCDNVTIEGLTICNGFGWQYTGWNNDTLTLRKCRTLTPKEVQKEWTDGINVSTTKNLLIENCIGICNDDSFASGHYPWTNGRFDNQDAVIRNYTSVNYNGFSNSARFGWDCYNDLLNYTFEGCEFLGAPKQGIYMNGTKLMGDGTSDRIHYGDFIIKNSRFDLEQGRDYFIFTESDVIINEIKIQNVDVKYFAKSQISGDVKKVTIENLTIGGVKVTEENYEEYFTFEGVENLDFELVIL